MFWSNPNPKPKSFWRSSEEWDLTKIFHEDIRWISSENIGKIFRRKDFKKIWIKTFSSKNLQKIYINFPQKIFKQFLPKFYLRSLKNLQLKSCWDFSEIFDLIFNFEKNFKKFVKQQKWSEDLLIKSSDNLLIYVQTLSYSLILLNLRRIWFKN